MTDRATVTRLRDWLDAAAHDLQGRLAGAGVAPQALLLSRCGGDLLGPARHRWPASRIAGLCHLAGPGQGRLACHDVAGRAVLMLEWEELPETSPAAAQEAFPVWLAARLAIPVVLHLAAATALIATAVPTVACIADHVRWDREDPLRDWPSPREGSRFPQMGDPDGASHRLEEVTAVLARHGFAGPSRVALIRRGPSGPTPAELRAFRALGAELVTEGGASEAIAARHCGRGWVSLALVLDHAQEPALHPGQLAERAERLVDPLGRLLRDWIAQLPAAGGADG